MSTDWTLRWMRRGVDSSDVSSMAASLGWGRCDFDHASGMAASSLRRRPGRERFSGGCQLLCRRYHLELHPFGNRGLSGGKMAHTGMLVDALKRELRSRGITYAALAPRLGLSEASVK